VTPDQEQRILAETWPDGTFGDSRPEPPASPAPAPRAARPRRPPPPVTEAEAARHQADLLAALDGFSCGTALAAHRPDPSPPHHLRLVQDPPEEQRRAG
jgi:hypothetical protein